ncbi:MAG: DinB family protein [Candidatus Rokubacteria bacterium]|nr:DinB family protein [Candidatus Rokubacteria bacterium]
MTDDARREAQARAREYFRTRGTLAPYALRDRIAAAFDAFETAVAPLPAADAARASLPGEWTVHEIVDHLVETHRPGLDELWCLLAGRRPPGAPIPAGLQSKAPLARPWPWLLRALRQVHADILTALNGVPADFATDARAPLVMVVNVPDGRGGVEPLHWIEDLDWKAYAITWRLHALDHLNQVRKVLAAARD